MAPERRRAILDLASRYRFPILELDPEFDYLLGEAASHPPLAAMDATGQVIYAGSLSRTLAPGLRLAYLALPVALADRLVKARQRVDWQGDALQEWVISELFLDGEYRRHLRRVRLDGGLLAATRLGYTAHRPEELQQAVALME